MNPRVAELRDVIIGVLRGIHDPEIPVNIYDLGLIYRLEVNQAGEVEIDMTLTSPGCPVAQSLVLGVEDGVGAIPGVSGVRVQLVWEPPWSMDCLSAATRLELGIW